MREKCDLERVNTNNSIIKILAQVLSFIKVIYYD